MNFHDLTLEERKERTRAEMERLAKRNGREACSSSMWEGRDPFFPSFRSLCRHLGVQPRWSLACATVGAPVNKSQRWTEWEEDVTENKRDILDAEKRPLVVVASPYNKPYRYWDTVNFCWRSTVVHPCGRFENSGVT